LATPVDLDSLAECLATALDVTVSQRRTMAVETRQHIEDKFSTQQMCNRTIAIYARLLKARHAKAGPIKASHIKDGGDHQHA
jgi:glycosyltransferase involved in cell wall biosynthesis